LASAKKKFKISLKLEKKVSIQCHNNVSQGHRRGNQGWYVHDDRY